MFESDVDCRMATLKFYAVTTTMWAWKQTNEPFAIESILVVQKQEFYEFFKLNFTNFSGVAQHKLATESFRTAMAISSAWLLPLSKVNIWHFSLALINNQLSFAWPLMQSQRATFQRNWNGINVGKFIRFKAASKKVSQLFSMRWVAWAWIYLLLSGWNINNFQCI